MSGGQHECKVSESQAVYVVDKSPHERVMLAFDLGYCDVQKHPGLQRNFVVGHFCETCTMQLAASLLVELNEDWGAIERAFRDTFAMAVEEKRRRSRG